jgi:hypothetical protein
MKKTIVSFFIVACFNSIAQPLLSKEGLPVLPKKGDWAIGVDATALIKLVRFNFVSTSNALNLKYMKDSVTAYRIGLRLGFNNYTSRARVTDRIAAGAGNTLTYPATIPMKENVWQRNSMVFGLSGGVEKRRGSGRLIGIYGIEGGFFISSSRDKFNYANALNASPLTPVEVDPQSDAMFNARLGAANNIDTVPKIVEVKGPARVVDRKNGLAFSIGARAFIGAEFFFMPKMSIGGEFGWGLGFTTTGRSETTYESLGNTSNAGVRQTTIDGGVENLFSFDTDNNNQVGGLSASLRLNLYF